MGEYDYANARLRAMKRRLFDRRELAALAALSRVDDLITRLEASEYRPEVEAALARYSGARVIMEAARLHLANTSRRIRGFFSGSGSRLIGILLARWDLFNLKTILRGQQAGAPPGQILETLVPAGELDEGELRILVQANGPKAVGDLLRTWNVAYAQIVREALRELLRTHEWSILESVLDGRFFTRSLGMLKKEAPNDHLVLEMLVREIDAANLSTALRLRQAGARMSEDNGSKTFLICGDLSHEWLAALVRTKLDEDVFASLRATKFRSALRGLQAWDLDVFQRLLDRDVVRFGVSFFRRDPLTIAPAIGFIAAMSAELKNLRLIAQGVSLGLAPVQVERELIIT